MQGIAIGSLLYRGRYGTVRDGAGRCRGMPAAGHSIPLGGRALHYVGRRGRLAPRGRADGSGVRVG